MPCCQASSSQLMKEYTEPLIQWHCVTFQKLPHHAVLLFKLHRHITHGRLTCTLSADSVSKAIKSNMVGSRIQNILKSPSHVLSIWLVHSTNRQLTSYTDYLLPLSWAPQCSLSVLTDAHFLRDKTAVFSAAITRTACCTASHMFGKLNVLWKHLTWQGQWIIQYLIEKS